MTQYIAPSMTIRGRTFEWGRRTYIMGIVNVSPESFSGDGVVDVDDAVEQAKRFEAEGADIIDVGGMSTRPDYQELSPSEELRRLLPALRAIVPAVELPVSVDTYRADVASQALAAGAHMLNDIMGLRRDPALARMAAGWGVPTVIMHNQRGRQFHDVIGDIRAGIEESLALAHDAGLAREKLIIDPGFGFGWQPEHSLEMVRRLGRAARLRAAHPHRDVSQVCNRCRARRAGGRARVGYGGNGRAVDCQRGGHHSRARCVGDAPGRARGGRDCAYWIA